MFQNCQLKGLYKRSDDFFNIKTFIFYFSFSLFVLCGCDHQLCPCPVPFSRTPPRWADSAYLGVKRTVWVSMSELCSSALGRSLASHSFPAELMTTESGLCKSRKKTSGVSNPLSKKRIIFNASAEMGINHSFKAQFLFLTKRKKTQFHNHHHCQTSNVKDIHNIIKSEYLSKS